MANGPVNQVAAKGELQTYMQDLEAGAVVGQYRDGLCDCCGDCGMFFAAIFCMPCLIGQIYEKVTPDSKGYCSYIFGAWMILLGLYYFVHFFTWGKIPPCYDGIFGPVCTGPPIQLPLHALFLLVVAVKTIGQVRKRYSIPSSCGGCCGDCCLFFWCPLCITTQMARHFGPAHKMDPCTCTATGTHFDYWFWDPRSWPAHLRSAPAPVVLLGAAPGMEEVEVTITAAGPLGINVNLQHPPDLTKAGPQAEAHGLKVGDRLKAVNGVDVSSWQGSAILPMLGTRPLHLLVLRVVQTPVALGAPGANKFCSGCGAPMEVGSKFCHTCGNGVFPPESPDTDIVDRQAW